METIEVATPDDPIPGTTLTLAVMQILEEAGIDDPGNFKMDNPNGLTITLQTTSAAVAQALRRELPAKGYNVLTPHRPSFDNKMQ